MNTLKEVIDGLMMLDKEVSFYIKLNFDEGDFHFADRQLGPLDFFNWNDYKFRNLREWTVLNESLLIIGQKKIINLNDYTTKDIDFTGCDPVIAEAIKENKMILCNVKDKDKDVPTRRRNIVSYVEGGKYPYGTSEGASYEYAEPISKLKTELYVKGPVEVMQWLIENDYRSNELGVFMKKNSSREFDFRAISACGKKKPEWWDFPELLEEKNTNKGEK